MRISAYEGRILAKGVGVRNDAYTRVVLATLRGVHVVVRYVILAGGGCTAST